MAKFLIAGKVIELLSGSFILNFSRHFLKGFQDFFSHFIFYCDFSGFAVFQENSSRLQIVSANRLIEKHSNNLQLSIEV